MATIHLPPDLKEFLQLLNSHHVEYLVIGGYAVGYHGYPRPTGDLDVWIAISPSNVQRVIATLNEFGFESSELPVLLTRKRRVIRMGVPPVKIDISTTISGVNFEKCYAERVVDELDGVQVNLINLKQLKRNKKASGRLKDLNDLENLP